MLPPSYLLRFFVFFFGVNGCGGVTERAPHNLIGALRRLAFRVAPLVSPILL